MHENSIKVYDYDKLKSHYSKEQEKFFNLLPHVVKKATHTDIPKLQKYLLSVGEDDAARYAEAIRLDLMLNDYFTDKTGIYDNNFHLLTWDKFQEDYLKFTKMSPDEKKKEGKKVYKSMRSDIENSRFAFLKYDFPVNKLKEIKKDYVQYTLKDKINYYSKRVNDKSLTEGQRLYALNFLKNNGVKLW